MTEETGKKIQLTLSIIVGELGMVIGILFALVTK